MAPATLECLLRGLIDYAGLFPPAGLSMDVAASTYAAERRGARAWMLGRFIVPIARLDELAATGHLATADEPWRLSVLAGADGSAARATIDAFAPARVDAVELRAQTVDEVERQVAVFGDLECYVEIPHERDPRPLLEAIARSGARAKIRTGGVTADAFPSAGDVARFIAAAAAVDVPIKATAGLHHPLRGAYRLTYAQDSPHGTMFGFLNVFLAAAFARAGLGVAELERLLKERDPAALRFTDTDIVWRGRRASLEVLRTTRASGAISYGSCSFSEPVEELRALGWL